MPYQITRQSPDLLVAFMRGNMGREAIEAFLQDIGQMLEEWPTPSDILIDGSEVQASSQEAQDCLERIVDNRHIRQIVCVAEKQHKIFSSTLARLVGENMLFDSRHEAIDFMRWLRTSPGRQQQSADEAQRGKRSMPYLLEFTPLAR